MSSTRPLRAHARFLRAHAVAPLALFIGALIPLSTLAPHFAAAGPAAATFLTGNWQQLSLGGPVPPPRRDMCFVYDPPNDRIIHVAQGTTFAMTFGGSPQWTNLGISSPPSGNELAVYDPVGSRVLLVTSSMQVFALPSSGATVWQELATFGTKPSARMFASIAYDSQRHRILIFGGGDPNLFTPLNDTWALDLGASMQWSRLNTTGPTPGPVGTSMAYDPDNDRLIAFGGSADFNYVGQDKLWALPLAAPSQWQQLAPTGTVPHGRILASLVRDAGGKRLVLFGGYGGAPLSDLQELDLQGQCAWRSSTSKSPWPGGRWSHGAAYRGAGPSMVIYAGLNGSLLGDSWELALPADAGPPIVESFSPLGGRIGDAVTISGYRLAAPSEVSFAGVPAIVDDYTAYTIHTHVPPGAVTGPIRVVTAGGTTTTAADFFVSLSPELDAASPDSGRYGEAVRLTGRHFTGTTRVRLGGTGSAPFTIVDDLTIDLVVDSLATTGPIELTTPADLVTSSVVFRRTVPYSTWVSPDSARAGDTVLLGGRNFVGTTKVMLGGTGSAGFQVLSDTLLLVTVDSLASSGKIAVRAPGVATTSTFDFLRMPDDPRPHVLAVRDVPADQGGKVVVAWRASDFDQARYSRITGYRVWRRVVLPTEISRAHGALLMRPITGPDGTEAQLFWENVATLPAAFLRGYAYTSETTRDSMAGDNPWTAFFVQAITADPYTFYNSNVDSGYSVDNLAPPTPAPFAVAFGSSENTLHWQFRHTADLREFRIHRGGAEDFVPSPGNLLAATTDTTYTDGPGAFYYKLVAVDIHGNSSRVASASPDRPVSTLAALVDAAAIGDRIRLRWISSGNGGLPATLYRRTTGSGWEVLATLTADGEGYLRYEDTDVQVGNRYGYRLGFLEPDATEIFTSDAWVTMEAARFALAGVHPNPAAGGMASIAFTLASSESARLEIFDLGGRRLESRDLGSPGPGQHVVPLSLGQRLSPGLYFVRLTSGGASQGARFAVVE